MAADPQAVVPQILARSGWSYNAAVDLSTGAACVLGMRVICKISRMLQVISGGDPLRHRNGDAIKVQRIGAEILTVLPLNAAQDWSHGVEVSLILQLSEDADIQVRLDVKYLHFAVREGEHEGVIRMRSNRNNSRIHAVYPLSTASRSAAGSGTRRAG
jgi:hypothetical protein